MMFRIQMLLLLAFLAICGASCSASSIPSPRIGEISNADIGPMLRDALYNQVSELRIASPSSSALPDDRMSMLWYDKYLGTMRWLNPLRADYNLDGEIGVSDLTPIALYFGADLTGYETYDPIVYWIDGNGDEEITIADITPIAQSFLASVDGFKIYTCDSFDPWAEVDASQWVETNFIQWSDCQISLGRWYEWHAENIGSFVKVQIEGSSLPANWITSAVLDVDSFVADAEPVTIREFTHPVSGDTFEIVDGRVYVRLSKSLSDPDVRDFVNSENLILLSQTYSYTSMLAKELRIKLPPETSVEDAVRFWPGKYHAVSLVNPEIAFELLDPLP